MTVLHPFLQPSSLPTCDPTTIDVASPPNRILCPPPSSSSPVLPSRVDFLLVSRPRRAFTGCTEGFSGAENCKENAMKTRNSITKFSTLESVMKLKLFLLCHSLNTEKFEFHYTFQGTEFGNGISSFHCIFFTVFCPRKPFCAPCD